MRARHEEFAVALPERERTRGSVARMTFSRRSLIQSGALALVAGSSFSQVITAASPAAARGRAPRRPFTGYGELVSDPNGLLDLPKGFAYRVFSREGDPLSTSGVVPASHDGMAAFSAGF